MPSGDYRQESEVDYKSDLAFLLNNPITKYMAEKYPHKTIAVRMSLEDCYQMCEILKEKKKNETD